MKKNKVDSKACLEIAGLILEKQRAGELPPDKSQLSRRLNKHQTALSPKNKYGRAIAQLIIDGCIARRNGGYILLIPMEDIEAKYSRSRRSKVEGDVEVESKVEVIKAKANTSTAKKIVLEVKGVIITIEL